MPSRKPSYGILGQSDSKTKRELSNTQSPEQDIEKRHLLLPYANSKFVYLFIIYLVPYNLQFRSFSQGPLFARPYYTLSCSFLSCDNGKLMPDLRKSYQLPAS